MRGAGVLADIYDGIAEERQTIADEWACEAIAANERGQTDLADLLDRRFRRHNRAYLEALRRAETLRRLVSPVESSR